MRLAYADPPYPGQAKRHYGNHPDYAGEVDHAELVRRLESFDGWALSTSMVALRDVLSVCPAGVVVAVWHNTDARPPGWLAWSHWYVWEPVIVWPARPAPRVKNLLAWPMDVRNQSLIGQKPPQVCEWIFRLLGADAESEDTLEDLFPGSGAVGRAWDRFTQQATLAV